MSLPPVSPNADILRLVNEGYEVEIRRDHLLLHHVPYVTPEKTVAYGILVSALSIEANQIAPLSTHVAFFVGQFPCTRDGIPMKAQFEHGGASEPVPGLRVDFSFSHKPKSGYRDYHHKMTRYVEVISEQAQAIDPEATAKTFRPIVQQAHESVFLYLDTNSTRAKIAALAEKLRGRKVAIIGLGGTGSYVLDLVAKTLVDEVHLFDGDRFSQHNAFRSPGAPSLEELGERLFKVAYFAKIYGRMRRSIHAHPQHVTAANVGELAAMDFVFICIDDGPSKKVVSDFLAAQGKTFIDVGLGVHEKNGKLFGIVRATTSAPEKRDHFPKLVSFAQVRDDVYDSNIQIAELNMLNAAMAVIKWKKLWGFYHDVEGEVDSTYTINTNQLRGDD
jgi:molybdopterin/thiamine biosynthesis adenylyltransferase